MISFAFRTKNEVQDRESTRQSVHKNLTHPRTLSKLNLGAHPDHTLVCFDYREQDMCN